MARAAKGRQFFNLFEEAGSNAHRAAKLLQEMISGWPDKSDLAREVLLCEQEGDRITHDIMSLLNSSSKAPLDREDIHSLAVGLDDVVDYTEEVADFLILYQIEAPMEQAQKLVSVLAMSCDQLEKALHDLSSFDGLEGYLIEINRLENEGDRLSRDAIASLFASGIDPMVVIRWKDIFSRLEQAIDATEKVANILEGICVKHG